MDAAEFEAFEVDDSRPGETAIDEPGAEEPRTDDESTSFLGDRAKSLLGDKAKLIESEPVKDAITKVKEWFRSRKGTEKLQSRLDDLRSVLVLEQDSAAHLATLEQFSQALGEREMAKGNAKRAARAAGGWNNLVKRMNSSTAPPAVLRLSSRTFTGNLHGSTGIEIGSLKKQLDLHGEGDLDYLRKWVKYRFQIPAAKGRDHLVMTQDTVVNHHLFTAKVAGKASFGDRSVKPPVDDEKEAEAQDEEKAEDEEQAPDKKELGSGGRSKTYGTITYRSATTYWLASDKSTLAYPNGSGVSFGLSISADRLLDYAAWCAAHPDIGPDDDALKKTEGYLSSQLRVETASLRKFFARFQFEAGPKPDTDGEISGKHLPEVARPLLVESSFAFRETTPLVMRPGARQEPEDLFEKHQPTRDRLEKTDPGELANSSLQALRIRYPLGEAENATKLYSIGINFLIVASVAAGRVSEVGSVGSFDLHTEFFPDLIKAPPADKTARRQWERDYVSQFEFAVPPVALFGDTS